MSDLAGASEPFEERYVFDVEHVAPAAAVLDAVYGGPNEGWEKWGRIEETVEARGVSLPALCVRSLGRIAVRSLDVRPQGRAGADLDQTRFRTVPAIAETDADEVQLWASLVDKVTVPGAGARLSDLLFLRREGNVGAHARRAVRAYLESVPPEREDDLDSTADLLRAWTLSRLINDHSLEQDARDVIEKRVDLLVEELRHQLPGVMFPLIRALVERTSDAVAWPAACSRADDLLKALASSERRGDLGTQIAAMRRSLLHGRGTVEDLAAIAADEVDAYVRDAAASANAAVRMHRLEAAAQIATQRGRTEQARAIVAEMQSISSGALGMHTVSVDSELAMWIPEAYIERFTRGNDWRRGVFVFLTMPVPPSGSVASLRAQARQSRGGLSQLFPRVLIQSEGLPQATLTTEQDKERHDVAFGGQVVAEAFGAFLAEALMRIHDKFGPIDLEELTTLITRAGAADPRLARSLAKGIQYFWAGDHEAAVGVVMPKIETAARGLLRELDEGIYQVQVNQSQGGYPGLHGLLTQLESLALDEDWAWYLRWLLLGPIGVNLRNEVAHGLVTSLRPEYTILVLRAAAVLITASPIATELDRHVLLNHNATPLRGRVGLLDAALAKVSQAALRLLLAVVYRRSELRFSATEE